MPFNFYFQSEFFVKFPDQAINGPFSYLKAAPGELGNFIAFNVFIGYKYCLIIYENPVRTYIELFSCHSKIFELDNNNEFHQSMDPIYLVGYDDASAPYTFFPSL